MDQKVWNYTFYRANRCWNMIFFDNNIADLQHICSLLSIEATQWHKSVSTAVVSSYENWVKN